MEIAVVPTFVIAQGRAVLDKLEAANAAKFAKRVDKSSSTSTSTAEDAPKLVDDALLYCLKKLVSASPVMLFMKRNPTEPKCGCSRQMVALLNEKKIQFGTFDITSFIRPLFSLFLRTLTAIWRSPNVLFDLV
ncbi:hypothetical protein PC110_g20264 [Phytophthora cactorum]|uniref:Uncharacterized protein n=1 Tax=Phytophthora cactorum TaxID=29920 RepID=A0A329RGR9_9STRA|nr:hypothetical protein PC110_g20264 [Phytophthora cactorum]